ncbi:MAG: hypothetical protein AMXMBFR47_36310 [Planctomycetota bacterium]
MCPEKRPVHDPAENERLASITALAAMLGDDVDALAAEIADSGLL